MRQLEELVRFKDSQGFYNKFAYEGQTLTFFDKVYIESTILDDMAREQRIEAESAAAASVVEPILAPVETPVIMDEPIVQEIVTPAAPLGITAGGDNNNSVSAAIVFPGVTTLIIVVTFILMAFQIIK